MTSEDKVRQLEGLRNMIVNSERTIREAAALLIVKGNPNGNALVRILNFAKDYTP